MLTSNSDVGAMLSSVWAELSRFPLDPSERIFWGFIVSSFLLALVLGFINGHSQLTRRQCLQLFSPRFWWTKDTLVDTSLLLTNAAIRVLFLIPLVGGQLVLAFWVARTLAQLGGELPSIQMHWAVIATLFTIVFFILEDFSRFGLHALMHRVPFLWHIHKVHHSAKHLTPLTLYRLHPLEMGLYYFRGVLVFGLVAGVFIYVFQSQLSAWKILGVDALGFVFNLAAANLRHSPVWLSFGRFERFFISPAQHHIHHSSQPEYRNKNFGVCLAYWDRLFGSWIESGQPKNLRFGLAG